MGNTAHVTSLKFLSQVPKNRIDLLPHYARLVATLNPYMPDIAAELISTVGLSNEDVIERLNHTPLSWKTNFVLSNARRILSGG